MSFNPTVLVLARPSLEWGNVAQMISHLGGDGEAWVDRVLDEPIAVSDSEVLIEVAGRACYRSFEVGLNPNVTRIRQDRGEYLDNLIRSEHGAVFEHAQWTFFFGNVSRILTHELVRHRVGVAISQESMRYVRMDKIPLELPDCLMGDRDLMNAAYDLLTASEEFMALATDVYQLDDPSTSFDTKKKVTSAMRRLAPAGHMTNMVWSANVRSLRHVIKLRTAPGAEEEIADLFTRVKSIMIDECPLLFGDLQ